jgi:hypothetical protein
MDSVVRMIVVAQAEVLADRVAIFCNGELRLLGTPLFLKSGARGGPGVTYVEGRIPIFDEGCSEFPVSTFVPCWLLRVYGFFGPN